MKRIISMCIVAVLLPFSIQQKDDKADPQFLGCFSNNVVKEVNKYDHDALTSQMIESRLEFSIDFTREVLKRSKSGTNVFFSPHSVYKALLLALFISNNKTENEIKTALRIPSNLSKLDVLRSFKMDKEVEKWRSLNASVDYELNEANRFFHQTDLNVKPCMKAEFADELQGLNFKSDVEQATRVINEWVSNQTSNQINKLLENNDLSEETKLVLVNAMYFKGLWQSKFLPENTRKDVFFLTPWKNSLVSMMRQKGNFRHLTSEKLESHVVELPYKGEHISMFIILPSFYHPLGIKSLLEKLTPDVVKDLVDPDYMTERPIELLIPKFTIEKTLEGVIPILESMGMRDLFTDSSDLSGLTGVPNEITFNEIVHKAKISVDEEGTKAAAATAIFTFRSSRPLDPLKIFCNHPFIYFIYDHISKSILFIGMYNNPNE